MDSINYIDCPKCGENINIEQVLADQTEKRLRMEFEKKFQQQLFDLKNKEIELEKEKLIFEEKKRNENQIFQEKLTKKLEEERKKTELELQNKYFAKIRATELELSKKNVEITNLKHKEIELFRKEEEIRALKERQNLELEKRLLEEKTRITEQFQSQFDEHLKIQIEQLNVQYQLQIKELQIQLEQQKKLAEELANKANQKSIELQGEAQERKLEEILKSEFPSDKIEEVPKGYSGADVLQSVINEFGKEVGKIIFESKRTKEFAKEWIGKLKDDQLKAQADIAILVTQSFPKDMERFAQKEGIWICHFEDLRQIVGILRETLIQISKIKLANENRGDKMKLLYDYLTGQEFATRVKNIIDSFSSMKFELDQEKRAFQRIWKQREVQIDRVISNTIDLYSTFSAIAGQGVLQIDNLDLPMLEGVNPEK